MRPEIFGNYSGLKARNTGGPVQSDALKKDITRLACQTSGESVCSPAGLNPPGGAALASAQPHRRTVLSSNSATLN